MNNKIVTAIVAGAAAIQFAVSFLWLAFVLYAYDYLTEKGYSFLGIVTLFAIITAFYRAMRTTTMLYSPPESNP